MGTEDIGLHPGDGFEIKYHMQKGASLVFAWKADGPIQFEFHGEPDRKPKADYFESYLLDDKNRQGPLLRLIHCADDRSPRLVLAKQGKERRANAPVGVGVLRFSEDVRTGDPPEQLTIRGAEVAMELVGFAGSSNDRFDRAV